MGVRVTQTPTEVLVQPTDVEARLTQAPVEVLVQPSTVAARVTQAPIEVLVQPRLTIEVPPAIIEVVTPVPIFGIVMFPPPAIIEVVTPPPSTPLLLHYRYFDVGGIGTWTHDRPFDIEKVPLAFGHSRPFDVGTTIGFIHERPFDVEGALRFIHERPFAILGDVAPTVGSDRPLLTPLRGLVLTAPTNGTAVLHVEDTAGVQPGMTAVIGTYTATVLAVTSTTVTLDKVIP